ncbi:MAG TPA: TPM domain-containing protein, partial [Longimicrobiales bacterium]|nr:TPM domain-containing protein [Longimicrobiales bacterium]
MTRLLAVLAAALVLAAPASAQRFPAPTGYVNDFANIIPAEREAEITRVIDEVRQKSGGEIVVATVESLDGLPLDKYALDMAREWGIGSRGEPGDPARNTGVLILVVARETSPDGRGHLKIELGTNANAFITATEAGRIADADIIPSFRNGDYGTGILLGVIGIAGQFAER